MSGYTVVDVETTGLVPERHDRIVEIGVVYVTDDGRMEDQWSTLVNPQRDVGPTQIHGISARDVVDAPTFADIAPYVLRALRGRVLVAHNASFDLRFLAAELSRAGLTIDQPGPTPLCTMALSGRLFPGSSRRLVDCCEIAGVQLVHAHSALGDARATAALLGRLIALRGLGAGSPVAYQWPEFRGTYEELRLCRRGTARPLREDGWLDRIVSRMPRAGSAGADAYLAMLEQALIDGELAAYEKDFLLTCAQHHHLTRGQILDLHGQYLWTMARVAWADSVVTDGELADLRRVAVMLGLAEVDVQAALDAARNAGLSDDVSGFALQPGDRVVFTGSMQRERSEWEALASAAGLVVGGVTRRTKVVVAADPDSASGKAAKARAYGIPVVTENAFAGLLEKVAAVVA